MTEHATNEPDTSKGWCCDGRTWVEHAATDGECCQSEGTQVGDLPPEGKAAAEERMQEETGGEDL